jgi:NADPH2:quinone reductase
MHYLAGRAEMLAAAECLFGVLREGVVIPRVHQTLPLSLAGDAHRAIQERRTTGSTVLLPFT